MLLAGVCVIGAGCIFSPDHGDEKVKPPPQYPRLDTPLNVLSALQLAYQNRDSVEYEQLYDSSYVGTSTDLNDPPATQVSTFRRADELIHIGALQHSTTISQVVFDLGPQTTWTRLSSDDPSNPDWAQIQIGRGNLRIEIYDGATLYSVQSINPVTFTLKPTPTGAPNDTLWKIIRWNEVGESTS